MKPKPKQNAKQAVKRKPSVFSKIFAYTMLLLALMSLADVAVFAPQSVSFYRTENRRQLIGVFQPMVREFEGKTPEEVADIARVFNDRNQSFRFIVKDGSGDVLFSSPDAEEDGRFQLMLDFARGTAEEDRAAGSGAVSDAAVSDTVQIEDRAFTRYRLPDAATAVEDLAGTSTMLYRTIHSVPEPAGLSVTATATSVGSREDAYTVQVSTIGSVPVDYADLAGKSLLALLIMIAIGVLGAVLYARKVTKPLEDELARERVMEENQRLFFSAASHELKTPIAATEALIEGMIANIGNYKNHPKYLRECLKNLDSQNRLVSEILELVKLSDEKAELLLIPLDLAEVGDSLIAGYRPLAEQRGVTISAAFPAATVRADRNLLLRALSNVIANAVQNTRENETIRIGAEKRERHIRLSVLNTGAHIPDEFLHRLFEPFYRPDPARSRNSARSGLGLTIVKKSLDRMGIPFALENSKEGVVFWMDLEPAG
jgi:two-component system sensor histidine kinase VanS